MRLKSFHAPSMSEAMRQVREVLGDDAIIINTREDKGGWVKITAAVEQSIQTPEVASQAHQVSDDASYDEETIIEMVTDTMLKHRVPVSVSEKVITAAMTLSGNDPKALLATALQRAFIFEEKPVTKQYRPIILVGPPGAGKTLMTAKMAARAVLDGKKPTVITTDTSRAGGVEQLSAYTNILSLSLLQAEDAKGLKAALDKIKDNKEVIIDTGGLNPFDPQEMKTLAKLINIEDMDAMLVLPAGIDAEESAEMAMTFSVLGVKKILPTRLDFSRRIGGILSAADRAKLAFVEGSHTPQVANGILQLTPLALAGLLMPRTPNKK